MFDKVLNMPLQMNILQSFIDVFPINCKYFWLVLLKFGYCFKIICRKVSSRNKYSTSSQIIF